MTHAFHKRQTPSKTAQKYVQRVCTCRGCAVHKNQKETRVRSRNALRARRGGEHSRHSSARKAKRRAEPLRQITKYSQEPAVHPSRQEKKEERPVNCQAPILVIPGSAGEGSGRARTSPPIPASARVARRRRNPSAGPQIPRALPRGFRRCLGVPRLEKAGGQPGGEWRMTRTAAESRRLLLVRTYSRYASSSTDLSLVVTQIVARLRTTQLKVHTKNAGLSVEEHLPVTRDLCASSGRQRDWTVQCAHAPALGRVGWA